MSDTKIIRKQKHAASLESKMSRNGYWFVLPWLIGFVLFFIVPAILSIWYTFSVATPIDEIDGGLWDYISRKFVGLDNIEFIWLRANNFKEFLSDSIVQFLYSLPIIIFLSLIFALVLNQKFVGRSVARTIFFIPVIVASTVVMTYLNGDANAQQLMMSSENSNAMYSSFSFTSMLENMGLPAAVTAQLSDYISQIFSLVMSCGIQTILFLAGLQAISAQYYEVAKVEGATAWETFWFVTFPMLSNILVLNLVYTCIDIFTKSDNSVMSLALQYIQKSNYNKASAIMWSYFAIVGLIIGALLLIFRKKLKQVEI